MEDGSRPNDKPIDTELLDDALNEEPPGNQTKSLRKYFTYLHGKTMNSHETFKMYLQEEVPGLQEVSTEDECDFCLAFCPVTSRVGTDIEMALKDLCRSKTLGSKPTVLVVLHHTFDAQSIVPDSSRIVNRMGTITVDCLFHEDVGLLQCPKNHDAIKHIKEWIQVHEEKETIDYVGWITSLLWNIWQTTKNLITGSKTDSANAIAETTEQIFGVSEIVLATKLRLVLLGRTGSGKSAAANTILGREERSQAGTSTLPQQSESRQGEVAGRKVTVVDTPDWFCPELSLEEVRQDVGLCVHLSAPGPHAFLLVIPVKQPAGEERGMLERMEEMFGEGCWRNTMILFTVTEEVQHPEQFIQSGSQEVQTLVEKCGNRFHCLNIKESGEGSQVSELLEKIEKMVEGIRDKTEIYKMICDIESEREERETTKEKLICKIQGSLKMTDKYVKINQNDELKIERHQQKLKTMQEKKDEIVKMIAQIRKLNEKLVGTEENKQYFKVVIPESQQTIWLSIPNKQEDRRKRRSLKEIETELSKLHESIQLKMKELSQISETGDPHDFVMV